MVLESNKFKVIFFIGFVLSIVLLWALISYWDISNRIAVCYVLMLRFGMEFFKSRMIIKRRFEPISSLPRKMSYWDYAGIVISVLICTYIFFFSEEKNPYSHLTFIFLFSGAARMNWYKGPAYILTETQLIDNDYNVLIRNLEDLHSIELGIFPRSFHINFVNQYSIKVYKQGNTNEELCRFVQEIINQAPVEADIQPEAQEFLDKYLSGATAGQQ